MKEKRKPPAEAESAGSGEFAAVRVDALRRLEHVVAGLGGDVAALLHAARIDRGLLQQGHSVVPFARVAELFEHASVALACPDFGLRLAAAQAIQGASKVLGPLQVAMCNSPTLGEALRYFANHAHAYSTALRLLIEKIPGDARVFMRCEFSTSGAALHRQAVEHTLALIQQVVLSLSVGRVRAREIWFTHDAAAVLPMYRTHFGASVRFGQGMHGLFFDECDFELALPNADPQLHEIATSFIDQRFPAAAMSLSERVRIIISRLLVEGRCTHDDVAAAVGMHARTLQRRLKLEGSSFEGIKDAVRREVALRYLQQPNISLVRVTEILGYSETSVLSRSCHRWFSASPRELRNGSNR